MTILECYRLVPWEEGTLKLVDLHEDDCRLIASGDKIRFSFPLEMKDKLSKCLGMRISILRTDDSYRMRILDDHSSNARSER